MVFARLRQCAVHLPWAHPVQISNGSTIGSAVFAGLTTVTDRPADRPTDRATQFVTTSRIYVRSTATRPIRHFTMSPNVFLSKNKMH